VQWQYLPYVVPLLVATVLSLGMALHAWRRRHIPGAAAFALVMAAVAEYALASAVEVLAAGLPAKLLAANLTYPGLVTIPPAWLVFALQFTGRGRWLTRPVLALLALLALLPLALVWTNDAHGLMRSAARLELSGPFPVLDVEHGPWYAVQAGYFYLMLLGGTALLVREFWLTRWTYRRQLVVLLPAMLVAWLANAVYVLGLAPLPSLDLTPFAISLTGLGFAWVVFRWRFLDVFLGLIPVARATIVDRMPDAVLVLEPDGRIVDLNPAAQRLIGLQLSAVVGQRAAAVFAGWPAPEPAATGVAERYADLILGEGPDRRDYHLSISPLRHARGRLAGYLVVFRDISERKRIEIEREEVLAREQAAHAEAQATVRMRDEFLAVAAHELRTPLTVLKGYAQLLTRQLQRPEPDRERLMELAHQLMRQLARFEALNQNLLDVAQLSQGQAMLRREQVDLVALAAQILARFEYLPERTPEHRLVLDAAGPVIGAVDPGRFDQMLTNLLSNALKYSLAGGEVRVSVRRVEQMAEVAVSDQGIGMSPAEQARLFQPFMRGERARARAGGSGLGLYITAQIVRHHGGTISVQSEPGVGTTIALRLPLDGPDEHAPAGAGHDGGG
jgi:signal transduction histidine kinase